MNESRYVSRGGLKLRCALDTFAIEPAGWTCVDLGCSTGGFTDCLLQAGAARVYAIDTGYGVLEWKLRNDERVVVMERSNALHVEPPAELVDAGLADLTVIDLGWTRQRLALPAATRWTKPDGRIITLIKPHYEQETDQRSRRGVLADEEAERIVREVCAQIGEMGFVVEGLVESPIRGGKGKTSGNREWLALVSRNPGPTRR
ncbi:MAG: methyltransferase domain-containing protein [Planctomycetota bacterium]|nr:MAG: methyltransferase domain-containing protein [Planctomycetota bacterium]